MNIAITDEDITLVETARFLDAVGDELQRARAKFPSSRLSVAALMEEVGELAQAMLKVAAGKWDKSRIMEEAIQVAAMACRVAVEGDSSFTEYTEPDDVAAAVARRGT